MFGGVAFMVCGNMSVGVQDESLMVRVGRISTMMRSLSLTPGRWTSPAGHERLRVCRPTRLRIDIDLAD